MNSMNINAHYGTKVIFSNPNSGYEYDQELAKKHLTVGKTYTVNHVDIHSWHTHVYLQEIPGVAFNSVLFDNKRR